MPAGIRIKRGTRAQLDAAAVAGNLAAGEPYLITDEGRIALGLSASAYQDYAKVGEGAATALVVGTPAGQVLAANAWTTITGYDTPSIASLAGWDGATGTLTVGEDGLYLVQVYIRIAAARTPQVDLLVNGVAHAAVPYFNYSWTVQLSAGDTVQVSFYDGGNLTYVSSNPTVLQVVKL